MGQDTREREEGPEGDPQWTISDPATGPTLCEKKKEEAKRHHVQGKEVSLWGAACLLFKGKVPTGACGMGECIHHLDPLPTPSPFLVMAR